MITESSLANGAGMQLLEPAQRYREFIRKRRAFVCAADRFYHEVVVYQWRVDALEAQQEAINEAIPTISTSKDDLIARCETACSRCNAQIDMQCSAALAGIEERARHYGLSSLTANGEVQIARGEEARKEVVAALKNSALQVFKELAVEVREVLAIADYDGLQALVRSLEKSRKFWRGQLEEVWAQWQTATESMHRAGDEALSAWLDIRKGFERLLHYAARPIKLNRRIADDLATALVHCFEVELYESIGLSGLAAVTATVTGASAKKDSDQCHPLAPEQRICFIKELYEILTEGDMLSILGEAIAKVVTGYSAPISQSLHVEIGRLQRNSDVEGWNVRSQKDLAAQTQTLSYSEVLCELLPRIRCSLAEALRSAVICTCEHDCNRVLKAAALLGGQDLVKAVICTEGPGYHQHAEERTPLHLAAHRNQNHRLLLDWLDGAQSISYEVLDWKVNPQDQCEEFRPELAVRV